MCGNIVVRGFLLAEYDVLSEIREVRERLSRIESMLRFIIERNIMEDDALPDEASAIESDDELVDYRSVRDQLVRNA